MSLYSILWVMNLLILLLGFHLVHFAAGDVISCNGVLYYVPRLRNWTCFLWEPIIHWQSYT